MEDKYGYDVDKEYNENENDDSSEIILVGTHIRKEKTVLESLKNYFTLNGSRACQIFLRSMNSASINITETDIKLSSEFIKIYSIPLFIHSLYIINLSYPWTKKDPKCESTWVLDILRSDLMIGNRLGVKGVIVHTGTYTHSSVEVSLDQMEKSIREVLPYATENCNLLLETPAGEGKDLCWKIEDFSDFYNRFTSEEKKKLAICIDSAHVWGAGYEPIEYLVQWASIHGVNSIKLVHLNDSAKPRNSHLDRHAYPGLGYIGAEKMNQIIVWCHDNKIPMVIE
jgi:deoxyribonuclease-4